MDIRIRYSNLRDLAKPILDAQKDVMPETFGMAVIDERKAVGCVLYSVEGPDRFCFNIAEGFVFPLHTSAPGKAFIAALPTKRQQSLLKRLNYKRFTPQTITSRKVFEAEIARIREAGYATDLSEETAGCHCGGIAVRDQEGHPIAALWVSGMDKRLPPPKLLACIRHLQTVARQIEKEWARTAASGSTAKAPAPCVAAVRKILTAHPHEPVDFEALAKIAGVSYSTLRKAFRAETGTTLGQYHLALRFEEARRLLMQTALPITEIATRTGFCNQKHFSAIFKRKTGLSPLACRRHLTEPSG